MDDKTKPQAATEEQQERTTTTIVIGGRADGRVVNVTRSSGVFIDSSDRYILSPITHNGEKRYFYRLESPPATSWIADAIKVWKQGAMATDVEAQPSDAP